MIDLLLFVCAKGSATDKKTNNLSIFEIIEQLTVDSFPLLIPEIQVICVFGQRNPDESAINFSLRTSLGDAVLHEGEVRGDFGGKKRNRSHVTMQGVLVPAPGILKVQLIYEGEPLGEWSMTVKSSRPTLFDNITADADEPQQE